MSPPLATTSSLDIEAVLGPEGAIANDKPNYEARPQQLEMAQAVARAIAQRRHLMVEAGTGVGKSYAYLVPSVLAGKKVVIATYTITLQEQLLKKDLPFLQSVMPRKFTFALAKGRSNYLSRRRLAAAARKASGLIQDADEIEQIKQLGAWSKETIDGSRSDLDFEPLWSVWGEVASDKDNCKGKLCPFHDTCFYYAARRRYAAAQIIVVNHALYFTDLAIRREGGNGFLPDHDVVIFDEAHHLEAVASEHLGLKATEGQLWYQLKRLLEPSAGKDTGKGLLSDAHSLIKNQDWLKRASAQTEKARQAATDFFDQLTEHMERESPPGKNKPPSTTLHQRQSLTLSTHVPLADALSGLVAMIGEGAVTIRKQASKEKRGTQWKHDLDDCALDLEAARDRIVELGSGIDAWLSQNEVDCVYWLEREPRKHRSIALVSAPVDVAPTLCRLLFDRVPTCILTSATLAVGKPPRFDYYGQRLGLDAQRCDTLQLGSPFHYDRQVKIYFPQHMPDPSLRSKANEFERQAIRALPHYIDKTKGNAFVLFTSYKMLRDAVSELDGWLEDQGYPLLVQGDGMSPSKMIARFKATPNSVLFGTDSFWQGVDVPGDHLSNVIITRLPFRMPDHPLIEARVEAIEQRGGNPFVEYSVPEAVIKLKQGFGRLIRSQTDYGIVVILDPRIRTKCYGRTFLDSLPRCPTVVEAVRDPASIPLRSSTTDADGFNWAMGEQTGPPKPEAPAA